MSGLGPGSLKHQCHDRLYSREQVVLAYGVEVGRQTLVKQKFTSSAWKSCFETLACPSTWPSECSSPHAGVPVPLDISAPHISSAPGAAGEEPFSLKMSCPILCTCYAVFASAPGSWTVSASSSVGEGRVTLNKPQQHSGTLAFDTSQYTKRQILSLAVFLPHKRSYRAELISSSVTITCRENK